MKKLSILLIVILLLPSFALGMKVISPYPITGTGVYSGGSNATDLTGYAEYQFEDNDFNGTGDITAHYGYFTSIFTNFWSSEDNTLTITSDDGNAVHPSGYNLLLNTAGAFVGSNGTGGILAVNLGSGKGTGEWGYWLWNKRGTASAGTPEYDGQRQVSSASYWTGSAQTPYYSKQVIVNATSQTSKVSYGYALNNASENASSEVWSYDKDGISINEDLKANALGLGTAEPDPINYLLYLKAPITAIMKLEAGTGYSLVYYSRNGTDIGYEGLGSTSSNDISFATYAGTNGGMAIITNGSTAQYVSADGRFSLGNPYAPFVGTNQRVKIRSLGASTFPIWLQRSNGFALMGMGETSTGNSYIYLYNSTQSVKTSINSDGNSYFLGGNVGVGTTSITYPITTGTAVSGISIYSFANVSASGYITRTSVYDKDKGLALDNIKDADDYKDENGKIKHSEFYGYTTYLKEDKTKPVYTYKSYVDEGKPVYKIKLVPDTSKPFSVDENGKPIYTEFVEEITAEYPYNRTEEIVNYPYFVEEEGVSLDLEIDLLRQAVYELKEKDKAKDQLIQDLTEEVNKIKNKDIITGG